MCEEREQNVKDVLIEDHGLKPREARRLVKRYRSVVQECHVEDFTDEAIAEVLATKAHRSEVEAEEDAQFDKIVQALGWDCAEL